MVNREALCRGCHARIEWAVFDRSTKAVALDVGIDDNGCLAVVGYRGEAAVPVVRLLPLAEIARAREARVGLRRAHYCGAS